MARLVSDGRNRQLRGWKAGFAVLVFVIIGFAACAMPDSPECFHMHAFLRLPLELPLVALALLLLPQRLARVTALLATVAVFGLLFLKLADIGVISAFQRRFNPYLDFKMMLDGWIMLSGTIGVAGAAIAMFLAITALVMLVWLFWWAGMGMARFHASARRISAFSFTLVLIGGLALFGASILGIGTFGIAQGIAEFRLAPYFRERLSLVVRSVADIRAFESELGAENSDDNQDIRFARIRGRDVIIVFVESYGRSAIEDPRYGGLVRPRLDNIEQTLRASGFAVASGWTRSPTVGGLSWLAHGTLLSGLWVDSQARYDRLMASRRTSLNRLFREAGWRTAAVMPAITMEWPDAAYYGYDQILAAGDLGYRGKSFNWVTMPDQYTLSAFERLVRSSAEGSGRPVMAEIALISSHAPWTPVPRMIDWEAVGDGTVFSDQAESGDTPAVVWSDHDRVRRQYAETIDYSLQVLGDYMQRYGREAVFVILGDHQPAALVTGPDASRAVPVHIISRDRDLVERFITDGFNASMTPSPQGTEAPMDMLRERLIRHFNSP